MNFENINAGVLSTAVTVTGSSSANTITTGSGNDTIDGGGGTDVIAAGGGNDSVSYYGNETSIDGGTGTNTLVMRTAATVNLGNADQTSGDTPNVTNFQNIDASALSTGGVADRFVVREHHHGWLGRGHDRWQRRRGYHRGGQRQ